MDSELEKIRKSLNSGFKEFFLKNDEHVHEEQLINGKENKFTLKFPDGFENIILISYDSSEILEELFVVEPNSSFRKMCDYLIFLKKDDKYYALAVEFKGCVSPRHLISEIEYGEIQAKNGFALLRYLIEINRNSRSDFRDIILGRLVVFKREIKKSAPNKQTEYSDGLRFRLPVNENRKLTMDDFINCVNRQNNSKQ